VLAGGEEISAKAVISNADPRRTLLTLVDPTHLTPDFVMKLQNIRMPGTSRKSIWLCLRCQNSLRSMQMTLLCVADTYCPEIDYLERAFDESKYGNFSPHPYLEVTVPSLTDPSLAPNGKHVMSIYMQYAPFKQRCRLGQPAQQPGEIVVKTLAEYAPSLPTLVEDGQIITPKDLETTTVLQAGISSTVNSRWTSFLPCVLCSTGRVTTRRYRTSIYAGPARIRARD